MPDSDSLEPQIEAVPTPLSLTEPQQLQRSRLSRFLSAPGVHVVTALIVVLSIGMLGYKATNLSHAATPPSQLSSAPSANCSQQADLQNPCRPLVGAWAYNYPEAGSDLKSQILYHEQRIGHQRDIVHDYRPIGSNQLNSADIYFANRANTTLFIDWKPAANWADANGRDAATNAAIDQMAASVMGLHKKIFLTINHEPENDVSGGAPGCSTFKGHAGTPADYIAMWHNVEDRFKADGVTNVEWSLDFINYPQWDCMIDQLYPGNSYVNWVWFNAYYGSPSNSFNTNVNRFTNLLAQHNTPAHAWLSKPQGIVEWSSAFGSDASQEAYYREAAQAIQANTFPRLRGFMVYDSNDFGGTNTRSFKVGYDNAGHASASKQAAYNSVVGAILGRHDVLGAPTTPTTPTPVVSQLAVPLHLNSGGGAYTDKAGIKWLADQAFVGGRTYQSPLKVKLTGDDFIYQSERYGMKAYHLPVANGRYDVVLDEAEVWFNHPNARVFSVKAEGVAVINDYDIYAKVGKNTVDHIRFPVTVVDGFLDLEFSAKVDYAKLSGIVILPTTTK